MPTPTTAEEVHPIYVVTIWKMGASVVFPIYRAVLAALGARAGSQLMVRVHPPYVTIRLAQPERIIPIDSFGPEHLPPTWPGKTDNETTPDDTARAVDPTT